MYHKFDWRLTSTIIGIVILIALIGIFFFRSTQSKTQETLPPITGGFIEGSTPKDTGDIASAAVCGDGFCVPEVENCTSCPYDCGVCE